jgi:cytochrome c oxidase cbb3-type subunit 4
VISGIFTLLAFLGFLGISAWAYARHNRARFDEASRLPLAEDPAPACGSPGQACCCGKQEKQS